MKKKDSKIEQEIEIFCTKLNTESKEQTVQKIAEKICKEVNDKLSGKVVTNISLLKNYCPAEEYHQKYLEKR